MVLQISDQRISWPDGLSNKISKQAFKAVIELSTVLVPTAILTERINKPCHHALAASSFSSYGRTPKFLAAS